MILHIHFDFFKLNWFLLIWLYLSVCSACGCSVHPVQKKSQPLKQDCGSHDVGAGNKPGSCGRAESVLKPLSHLSRKAGCFKRYILDMNDYMLVIFETAFPIFGGESFPEVPWGVDSALSHSGNTTPNVTSFLWPPPNQRKCRLYSKSSPRSYPLVCYVM